MNSEARGEVAGSHTDSRVTPIGCRAQGQPFSASDMCCDHLGPFKNAYALEDPSEKFWLSESGVQLQYNDF